MSAAENIIPFQREPTMSNNQLPDPLTPADADLTGFEWMELNIHRLFRSEMWARASGDEFRAALKLWGESFLEQPAGSLPDDDFLLARLADYGRDVKGWEGVKAMALRGWVKCSDGRLYHPVVAETVMRAWEQRLKFRERQDYERERKRQYRESLKGQKQDNKKCPDNVPGTDSGRPKDFHSKTGTGTETGNITNTPLTPQEKPTEQKPDDAKPDGSAGVDAKAVVDVFHAQLPMLPATSKLNDSRKKAIAARTREMLPTLDDWTAYFAKVAKSRLLTGQETTWKASFDWLLKPANMLKVLEGNYQSAVMPNSANGKPRDRYNMDDKSWIKGCDPQRLGFDCTEEEWRNMQ
ncbi:hypothetical protein VSS37_15190 [Candidatus Thiothrix sp. Deng01]|uniref:DUF1376 domain-containing protein n=1 Tax=Candidatus Thiothrix phosphatis TaxID=3112415 RepID=A0ABU6CZR7_9GAMM|nr:hypothetical protein [Candidatus Thiothrix sp. Deng01]MEB4592331.1 hypothetical protein [Candidatus Thiothrix sp. Deng01]